MQLGTDLKRFASADAGATSADWVLMAGAVCGMALTVSNTVMDSTTPAQDHVNAVMSLSLVNVRGFARPAHTCPTVAREGSVTRWTTDRVCNDAGDFCHPEVHHAIASYTMRDGSAWTAQMSQAEGERLYVRWFDETGTEVPAPCFPD